MVPVSFLRKVAELGCRWLSSLCVGADHSACHQRFIEGALMCIIPFSSVRKTLTRTRTRLAPGTAPLKPEFDLPPRGFLNPGKTGLNGAKGPGNLFPHPQGLR